MAEEQMIYKPRDMYEHSLKKQYHQAADEYFEALATKASTDKGGNKIHLKALAAAREAEAQAEKKAKKAKRLATFVLVIGILLAVAIIGIFLIILYVKKLKPAASNEAAALEKAHKKTMDALDVCYADLATLNALLDWNMPADVMEKATPIIDLDHVFSPQRLEYLVNHYGMTEDLGGMTSVLGVQSGNIQGNPFLLIKTRKCEIKDKEYQGTLTITWTETRSDGRGGTTTVTRSETLVATIEEPAPFHGEDTVLIFGNEAAPKLHFSRFPSGVSGKSEKDIDKFVKNKIKEFEKREKKAMKSGKQPNFTVLGNDEFEALFGAQDRDNEVQFRLLFTPLAQTNMVSLIKNPEPFGDDFVMCKDGMINSVASRHSQSFDYSANPDWFAGYDYEAMKKKFVDYCDAYIKGLFFDLAPLLSIPLYQMHQPHEYIYKDVLESNVTSYEQEAAANAINPTLFKPEKAGGCPLILKAVKSSKVGKGDQVTIKAIGYQETPRVTYVSKMGGDGRMHQVPVHWIQYDEVTKTDNIGVEETNASKRDYMSQLKGSLGKYLRSEGGSSFQKGIVALFLGGKNAWSPSEADGISSLFTKKEN